MKTHLPWLAFRSLALACGLVVVPLTAHAQSQTPTGSSAPTPPGAQLIGRAVLPADTFAEGPPSGAQITGPTNDRKVPFASQPVQGVSGIMAAGDGSYWALEDNGYGAKENSNDFLLRVYKMRPSFKTAHGGDGSVKVESFIQLRDPDKRVPFSIVNQTTSDRLLTGADFDIESIRRDLRGDLWFGDEFGPWLLHTDGTGRLLEAPIGLPGVKAPQNATLGNDTPTLGTSRGFEGVAVSPDGATLYPMLEGALTTDFDQRRRYISQFDLNSKTYTGTRWAYRMESAGNSIGDLTAMDPYRMLVIERDQDMYTSAKLKTIYAIDLRVTDLDGYLVKTPVLNLLAMRDPAGISLPARVGDYGIGDPFLFPFVTIESVLHLDGSVLVVVNDNNYPFSNGRNLTRPDDTEFIMVQLDAPLPGTEPGTSAT